MASYLLLLALLVLEDGRLNLVFKALHLFRRETVDELDAGYAAATHHAMPDAIVDLAFTAADHRHVGKVSAVVTLMRVFCHLIPIVHDLGCLIV